jgi:prepilin-type N-terminal cleavage/methylation domain-containing protein
VTRTRDGGFTLVELLVSLSIFGVIMAALVGAMFEFEITSTSAQSRMNESNDALRLADYFARDMQNATAITASAGCMPAGASLVVALTWTDRPVGVLAATAREIDYSVDPTTKYVTRSSCTAAVRSDKTLTFASSSAAVTACTDASGATAGNSLASCTAATVRTVSLTITESSGTTFTASGARRPT